MPRYEITFDADFQNVNMWDSVNGVNAGNLTIAEFVALGYILLVDNMITIIDPNHQYYFDAPKTVGMSLTVGTEVFPLASLTSRASYFSGDFFYDIEVREFTIVGSIYGKNYLFGACPECPPATVSAPSLNGNGSEYIDGTEVTVSGRDTVYTVVRSYMTIYTDSGYTVHYDLEATNGAKLSSPEALLTKYVAPVITP